ncbi:MAG: type VI secretion system baseplate subunit TssG [Tannerella sp.]|jgi:hypothetical protein|nr:type VI secretion system baseplate subunit TssG [Tannerella sp.]
MSSEDKTKKIIDLDSTDKQANTIDSDYKAELVAASLVEQGYDLDRIIITREGAARRGFAKDIESINIQFSQYDLLDYLYIKANKEGIYDILPEGLFHQSTHTKKNKDKEDILDDIKLHRQKEFFARIFFRPLEIEVDRMLIEANLFETRYDKKISNPNFVNIFVQYWPVLQLLKRKQAIFFMHAISVLHKVRNRYREIEISMSSILDVPVRIKEVKMPAKEASRYFESRIGDTYLGTDWVLGKCFDDGKYDLHITIGPISAKEMEFFLETATGNTLFNYLCKLFLPTDIFVEKEFKILPQDADFLLSGDEQITYLGINTFI